MAQQEQCTLIDPLDQYRSCVYFMRSLTAGLIKIGQTSKSVTARARAIRVDVDDDIEVIGVIPTDTPPALERKLHKQFDHIRVRGEWFEPDKLLLDFISKKAVFVGTEFYRTSRDPRFYTRSSEHRRSCIRKMVDWGVIGKHDWSIPNFWADHTSPVGGLPTRWVLMRMILEWDIPTDEKMVLTVIAVEHHHYEFCAQRNDVAESAGITLSRFDDICCSLFEKGLLCWTSSSNVAGNPAWGLNLHTLFAPLFT